MKLKPYTSVEQYWEVAEREEQRQKEALRMFYARQLHPKVITGHKMAVFFGWCCAIPALGLLGYEMWTWLKIWFWGDM